MHSCSVSTPVGRLVLVGDEEGLRRISFPRSTPAFEPAEDWQTTEEPFRETIRQLTAYFAGELDQFDLVLAPVGTPFQQEVWSQLRLGRSKASRAVGAANGRNPIPIVIPCHRVVGADGSLTGFGGGLEIKRQLLALEARYRRDSLFRPSRPLSGETRSPR
jgi:methylated-DNA-[protein]-cysteine S-methyltransferase